MEGNLTDLNLGKNLSVNGFIEIIKSLTFHLYCLYQNTPKYYYLDLKCENILYKCIGEDRFKIFLGDLGSFRCFSKLFRKF